jgi:hypothetical protein
MRNPLDAAQESRRLTRAREISPTASSGGVMTSADNADPFAEAKKPEPAKPASNEWLTTIIRGKESHTRTFPLPDSAAAAEPDAKPDTADEDRAPKTSAAPADEPVQVKPIGAGAPD